MLLKCKKRTASVYTLSYCETLFIGYQILKKLCMEYMELFSITGNNIDISINIFQHIYLFKSC